MPLKGVKRSTVTRTTKPQETGTAKKVGTKTKKATPTVKMVKTKQDELNGLYAERKWLISVDSAALAKRNDNLTKAKNSLNAYKKQHPYKTVASDVLGSFGWWSDKNYVNLKNNYAKASEDVNNFRYDPVLDEINDKILDITGYGYDD